MGLLIKIILFGVAAYAVWRTYARWKGLFDRFVGNKPPVEPPRPAPPPPAAAATPPSQARLIDTVQCAGCGAYISTDAEKCSHCGRPRP